MPEGKVDPRTGVQIVPLSKLPDEVIEALIACKDAINRTCWEVGAIANLVYDWAQRVNDENIRYEVDKTQIYGMVGRVIGKSGRTVRWYAETEIFYRVGALKALREEHNDLPFSHFAFARRFGEKGAEEVLVHSLTLAEEQGYPPSVDRLEMDFADQLEEIQQAERTGAFLEGRIQKVSEHPGEEGAILDVGAALIGLVEEGIGEMTGQAVEPLGLPEVDAGNEKDETFRVEQRLRVAARVALLGEELAATLAELEEDQELLRRRRGLAREIREVTRRVVGLGRWIRRFSE